MKRETEAPRLSGGSYVGALVALLALTALSLGMAQLPLGPLATPVALLIAAVKALVVGAIFMHLTESVFATRVVGLIVAIFIALLALGMYADVALR